MWMCLYLVTNECNIFGDIKVIKEPKGNKTTVVMNVNSCHPLHISGLSCMPYFKTAIWWRCKKLSENADNSTCCCLFVNKSEENVGNIIIIHGNA